MKSTFLRALIGFLIVAVVAFSATLYYAFDIMDKSLPVTDGELQLHGLTAQVSVYRDAYGVPHIRAESEPDLMRAVGYVHAQDRLWQMDLTRRAAAGRLSEIFGKENKILEIDRMLRTVGIARMAPMLADSMDVHTRSLLQAYTDGVNAFLEAWSDRLPVEFVILGYEPEPWTIYDCVAIARIIGWELNLAWKVDVAMTQVVHKVGLDKASELFPDYPAGAPLIVPDPPPGRSALPARRADLDREELPQLSEETETVGKILQQFGDLNTALKELTGFSGSQVGSNAWAVSGRRSVTGKPLLANDPHLAHSIPARWYEVHMAAPGIDVNGMTLAGAPFVVLGSNRSIAWGLTNVMIDDSDFYIESVRKTENGPEYLRDGKWLPAKTVTEFIRTKDDPDSLRLEIVYTDRGPIISNVHSALDSDSVAISVSMRWTGFEPTDEATAFYRLNRARNWEEFRSALKGFGVPGQNVVYADTAGNIGYLCTGRIPIRKSGNGLYATSGDNVWTGFVSFGEQPFLLNPSSGYVASSNNKVAGPWFPYRISSYWEPPSRAQRVNEILQSKEVFSVEDFQRLQGDFFSHHAKEVTPFIIGAYRNLEFVDPLFGEAFLFLQNWDFDMSGERVAASIFNEFFVRLIRNTFEDELGPALFAEYASFQSMSIRSLSELLNQKQSAWFDDVNTGELESRDMIVRQSFEEAVAVLVNRFGTQPATWQWKELNTLTFEHPIGSQKPLNYLFNSRTYPVGGNTTTVNNMEYKITDPFKCVLGPSMRRVVDLSDMNRVRSVITVGQSGQPTSDHYQDQVDLWLTNAYKLVPLDWSVFSEDDEYDLLLLVPEAR